MSSEGKVTIELEDDVAELVESYAKQHGISDEEALSRLVREGIDSLESLSEEERMAVMAFKEVNE